MERQTVTTSINLTSSRECHYKAAHLHTYLQQTTSRMLKLFFSPHSHLLKSSHFFQDEECHLLMMFIPFRAWLLKYQTCKDIRETRGMEEEEIHQCKGSHSSTKALIYLQQQVKSLSLQILQHNYDINYFYFVHIYILLKAQNMNFPLSDVKLSDHCTGRY